MKNYLIFGILMLMSIGMVSAEYSWTEQTGSGNKFWAGVTTTDDGSLTLAPAYGSYIYSSNDSGITWNAITSAGSRAWFRIAKSLDAQYIAAIDYTAQDLFLSNDYGATWNAQGIGGSNYEDVAMSSNGQIIATVTTSGYLYISTDGGAGWSTPILPPSSTNTLSVDMSSDGSVIYIGGNYLWITTDYGNNIYQVNTTLFPDLGYRPSVNSDGTKIAVAKLAGYIYTSIDSGATWTEHTTSGTAFWRQITMSEDGTKIAVVPRTGYLITSVDSGNTWTQETTAGSRTWWDIDMTADGSTIFAAAQSSNIWTGELPCVPNWSCTGYASCVEPAKNVSCNNVTDLNTCSVSYSGNYSEFAVQSCAYERESSGGTRYLVDASGNVVGVMQGQQLVQQQSGSAPQLSIAGEGVGFDILAWFKDLWTTIKGWFG